MLTSSNTDVRLRVLRPGSGAATRAGMARLAAAVGRWYRLRRDARRLMAFNDHLLSDIGLGRGGIEFAVWSGRRP